MAALLDQNRIALISSQHADVRSNEADYGRANENGFEIAGVRPLGEVGLRHELGNTTIDLAAVRITLYCQVHKRQTLLGWMRDL